MGDCPNEMQLEHTEVLGSLKTTVEDHSRRLDKVEDMRDIVIRMSENLEKLTELQKEQGETSKQVTETLIKQNATLERLNDKIDATDKKIDATDIKVNEIIENNNFNIVGFIKGNVLPFLIGGGIGGSLIYGVIELIKTLATK